MQFSLTVSTLDCEYELKNFSNSRISKMPTNFKNKIYSVENKGYRKIALSTAAISDYREI
jgi:hypothetical protein